jgi:two-component system response regulator AtoC
VLVVDDDPSMRSLVCEFVTGRGCSTQTAAGADEAIRRFQAQRPSAVILDVAMPGSMDGLGVLAALKRIDRDVPVIVLSGEGRTSIVVSAMKLGAIDFVNKPFDQAELDTPLTSALRQRQVSREVAHLREELQTHVQHQLLFGGSERMGEVRQLIERVADTDVTVLIRGESGTGKELVARAIHAASGRRHRALVKVNCAALPTELLESELFGYERGAFTGAIQHKPGKFEFANHGTMFLDEIGEMSEPLQAKLLQVLQDGEFSRLGGKQDVRVDVRILAATNRDLERAVSQGAFREDLYYRLNVVAITLPPLRDRLEEVPLLSDYLLKKYSVQYNKPHLALSAETLQLMMRHDWPGNIRELENLIKRFVVLGSDAAIRREIRAAAEASPKPPPGSASPGEPPMAATVTSGADAIAQAALAAGSCSLKDISRAAAREAERALIARMLHRTRWNRKETADLLGISYKALLYKIKENGLDKAS